MTLRPAQQKAVDSLAPRIAVNAGPGSGKTRVLVERILRAVHGGRLKLDRVLAITFTINAAAEMKNRLAERLPRAEVEAAAVSTIHAFCATLLRQYPVESRVDPAFRVLEEIEADVLKQRVMDSVLDALSENEPLEFAQIALHVKGRSPAETLLQGYAEVLAQGGGFGDPKLLMPDNDFVMYEHVLRVATTLCRFHASYQREKQLLSALDFDDLEQRVRRLLEDDAIAGAIARRFDEILVDEYQDTSLAQAAIIKRIADSGKARWFVVGDPKQSIYAFRNARPENFAEAIAEAGDAAIDLVEDFRSRPEVLAAINAYFQGVAGFGGPRGYIELQAGREFEAKTTPSVELLQSGTRPEEAVNIAKAIRHLHDERGVDCGGIAILFRVTTDMSMYEEALAGEDVPYFSETGRGYYDTREVVDVIAYLHVLDNHRDEIALATVLRSPMYGLTDDALYLLATYAHGEDDHRPHDGLLCDILGDGEALEPLPPEDRAIVARFVVDFENLREVAVTREIASLIHEIVRVTGYEQVLGARGVANVRKLAEMARVLGASSIGAGSPGEFARAVDHFRAEEVREAEAHVPIDGGAVRLMTMHAAKGLEFPVVILPDLGRPDRPESAQVDYHPQFGLGASFHDIETDKVEKTPTLEEIRKWKKDRNAAEAQRLLFVAMTRAEDHLILSGSKQANDRYKRIVRMGLPAAQLSGAPAFAAVASAASGANTAILASRSAPAADESDYAAAITDVAEFASCPRRYYLGRYLGFSNDGALVLDEDAPPAGISAAERGTLVHRRLAGEAAASAETEQLARRFEQSELGRRLLSSRNVEREIPIVAQLEGRILHGVIDLRSDGVIVDYKTGAEDDARYAVQMQLYGLLTGARELYLYYLDQDIASRIEPNPLVRDTARRFFAAQQALDFPATVAGHCTKCPFSGRQCLEPQKVYASAAV